MARERRKAAVSPQDPTSAASGNEVEAWALVRMIRRAQGFALGIAVANTPSLRRAMVEEIRRLCPEKKIIQLELDRPISSLLSAIEEAFGFRGPSDRLLIKGETRKSIGIETFAFSHQLDALFVYGLENSISGAEGYVPIFGNLNLTRNLFPQKCPYPIVLWLPQYAVGRLSQYAPDFFSWRSGTYTFSLEAEDFRTYVADQLRDRGKFEELTGVEKEDRILALEEILRRLRDLPEDSRVLHERIYALDALGALYFFMGRYERSAACYREALEISRTLGNREGESSCLHQLGIIAEEQGDLQQAERLYRESLVIVRALGDRAREAATLHNLGVIAQERGDLAEAERLYRESLVITRALGNRPREAATLHQLGTVAQKRGDLTEAERLYRESLVITRALGNRPREAATLHQLGRIAQERGDLAEAERLYRESLEIAEQIGLKDAEIPRRSLERIRSRGLTERQHKT